MLNKLVRDTRLLIIIYYFLSFSPYFWKYIFPPTESAFLIDLIFVYFAVIFIILPLFILFRTAMHSNSYSLKNGIYIFIFSYLVFLPLFYYFRNGLFVLNHISETSESAWFSIQFSLIYSILGGFIGMLINSLYILFFRKK